ncbi:MAG: hypothetical protein NTW21_13465 [Verrucomicrobia bacterium]|nr:hypothetical protein [Verrucomicrobiota bacterium]
MPWAVVFQAVGLEEVGVRRQAIGLEEVRDAGVDLLEELLVFGFEIGVAEPFELELEVEFVGEGFQFGLALLDALSQMGDGFLLRDQSLQLLFGGRGAVVLEVVGEVLEGGLDCGGGDGLVFLRFVGGEFLADFHGFGEFALGLADGCLQRLDGIDKGQITLPHRLEERGDVQAESSTDY